MATTSGSSMRGLNVFISDLRACRTREQEEKRINKEFANVRSKFKEGSLSGYDKKKYVCKLLYIYLLGWDVDFGHVEAVNLISSNKYSEKQIGYLGITLLLTENHELVRLVINSIKKDLEDRDEVTNCLALQGIANLGGQEVAEALAPEVFKALVSGNSVNFVKKKAALCLLRLYRKHPDVIPVSDWAEAISGIIDDYDLGVNTSVMSLINVLAAQHPDLFNHVVSKCINKLHKVVVEKEVVPDNIYYTVPVPWLQVKLLKCLQIFPAEYDAVSGSKLNACLSAIMKTAQEPAKNVQQNNAVNCVFLEAIPLMLHLDPESEMVKKAVSIVGRYISSKETNMRYLGLETYSTLTSHPNLLGFLKNYQEVIFMSVRDKDISVRRQALDVLYGMCDQSNSQAIVNELMTYLPQSEYAIREEMVLKIAILTEKFATEPNWYVDIIFKLISIAGDNVSNEVWHRVIQIVTNNPNLHQYAARAIFAQLKSVTCHENAIKVGGYLLGEYGDLIANEDGSNPALQLQALHSKFTLCSVSTRALLLSTYAKFANLFPEIKYEILQILRQHRSVLDTEMQQRSCEYFALCSLPTEDLLQAIFEPMPPFPERESALIQRLQKHSGDGSKNNASTDRRQGRTKNVALASIGSDMTAAKSPERAQPASSDLLGLDALVAPSASVDSLLASKLNAWYLNLLLNPSGIFYEDERVQIGVKTEYQGVKGRLAFFLGNKTQATFQNVSIAIQPSSWCQFSSLGNVETIAPMAQVQQAFEVLSVALASDPVMMSIGFSMAGTTVRLPTMTVPVNVCKFQEPIAMQGPDFMNRWRQIGGPPKESQEVFELGNPLTVDAVRQTLTQLKVNVLLGVDPNPSNLVGTSVLQAQSVGKVGCLLRLEVNEQQRMYRLTVRATNDAAPESLKNAIKEALMKQTT